MKEKTQTDNPTPSENSLMAKLGISENQIQEKETKKKTSVLTTLADKLKEVLRNGVKKINAEQGKLVSFVALKRDGTLKDANGKKMLDENKKPIPRYVKTRIQGHFTIDKLEDGFFQATRGVQYTESHTIADFQELENEG